MSFRNTCQNGQVCGHYTQLVWANSNRVGCARVTCPSMTYKYNILCDYAPAGNYVGQWPYIAATTNVTVTPSFKNGTDIVTTKSPSSAHKRNISWWLLILQITFQILFW